jgi:hypothetical protein
MQRMEKHIGDHIAPPIAFVPFKQVPEGEVKLGQEHLRMALQARKRFL